MDGSNQSAISLKTCNQSQSLNRRHNQNNYYKRQKTKVISLEDKQCEPQTNGDQSDSTHKPISSGPPAPPPRPLTVGSIREANEANRLNLNQLALNNCDIDNSGFDGFDGDADDDDLYYNYCHVDKSISKLTKSGSDPRIAESVVTSSSETSTGMPFYAMLFASDN